MSRSEPTTKFQMPDAGTFVGGHASIDMYLWREDDFKVSFRPVNGHDMVCLKVGMLSVVVTPEQWRAIADAVASVLPAAEFATEAVQ